MGGGTQAPTAYQPAYEPQVDYATAQNIQKTQNLVDTYAPGVISGSQTAANSIINTPTAQQFVTQTSNLAPQYTQYGQNQMAQAQQEQAYADSQIAQAYDPLNAVYNQQYQQLMDQQNAINAQNGVAGSPFGAGIAGQVGTNFNLDWQAQKAAREQAALAAYGTATGQANDLGMQGLATQTAGAAIPYEANLQVQNNNLAALAALANNGGAAISPMNQSSQAGNNYLSAGTAAAQANLQSWQAQQQADNSLFGDIFGAAFKVATGGIL